MSVWLSILVWTVIGTALLAVLIAVVLTGKPIRHLLISFVQGVCAIAAVDMVGVFTGVSLGFGWFTLLGSAAFGVPGVTGMLLLRMLAL